MSLYKLQTAKAKTRRKRQQRITADYILQHLKIADRTDNIIPFVPNKIQRLYEANRTRRDLILKSRQVGMTTYCRAVDFAFAQTEMSRQLVITDKSDNTAKLRRMNERFYNNLPSHLQIGKGEDNKVTTVYSNGSEISIDTARSGSAGRASTFTRLHASEVAYWADGGSTMSGILNTMGMRGYAVAESTPNGAQGWFYDECMKALDGDSTWTLHFFEWWLGDENVITDTMIADLGLHDLVYPYTDEESELVAKHGLSQHQIYWRRFKIKEDPFKFKQEHPEDVYSCFLTSGNSFFGDIEHVFTVYEGQLHQDYPMVAGLDFGQSDDFTVMVVIDPRTNKQVDKLRINRMLWETMRERIAMMCRKWNVSTLVPEINSIGSVNIEQLRKELADYNVTILPFRTTPQSKPALVQALYAGLHEQGLRLRADDSELRHELRNFISKQSPSGAWQYEGANGAHDDCVIALALAWLAVMRGSISIEAI